MDVHQYHKLVRTIVLVDIPAAVFLVSSAVSGWPVAISKHELMFWLGLIAFSSITLLMIAGMYRETWKSFQKDRVDLRIYEEQQRQIPPPLSSFPAAKISEEASQIALQKTRRLHGVQRKLHRRLASPQTANPQDAKLQTPFATGYRPPSNALANPQPAHLQSIDEIDATILAAGKELQAQGIKVTGIAIANMTGIAERTVYDRLAKMKQKGGDV